MNKSRFDVGFLESLHMYIYFFLRLAKQYRVQGHRRRKKEVKAIVGTFEQRLRTLGIASLRFER